MTAPHATRPRAVVRAVILALLCGACSLPPVESGRPPEGEIRPMASETEQSFDRPRRTEPGARASSVGAAPGTPASLPLVAADDAERFGDPATRRFHVRSCPELASAPAATRVPLRTAWAGIDFDFAPCPVCRPMPGRE